MDKINLLLAYIKDFIVEPYGLIIIFLLIVGASALLSIIA
jgi:hypothetical protein